MLIPTVEDGLEAFWRATLPLPREVGDVSFETPASSWSSQVNRITVNAFLYGISRSAQPPRPAAARATGAGAQQRAPLPMVQLDYLVSAWASVVRDEHQLLGDVMSRVLAHQVLPPQYLSAPLALASGVQLAVVQDQGNRPRDLWGALGGQLRASFLLMVTVAGDAFDWEAAPPAVTSVAGSAVATPRGAPEAPAAARGGSGIRREGSGLVRDADGSGPA